MDNVYNDCVTAVECKVNPMKSVNCTRNFPAVTVVSILFDPFRSFSARFRNPIEPKRLVEPIALETTGYELGLELSVNRQLRSGHEYS